MIQYGAEQSLAFAQRLLGAAAGSEVGSEGLIADRDPVVVEIALKVPSIPTPGAVGAVHPPLTHGIWRFRRYRRDGGEIGGALIGGD